MRLTNTAIAVLVVIGITLGCIAWAIWDARARSRDLHIRLEKGEGKIGDLALNEDICNNMDGTTICAFGEATAWPMRSMVKKFRTEYEQHITEKRCPFGKSAHGH